ncbi:DUF4421 family protein [Bdellovibrio svalbardensis]|uniref:DUF4421 domain-containing protein n=1 Tax=Bdellovibrio svalbardensis TaxID=2972972 RepID=A0ABT6DE55_9BACT|nr:DUF4421 family protein [Bdellovibrio svalbardensis]MDG0815106.1 DUF4421 domain-containing protein [Bdellovibrio svalbardensis]
MLFPFCIQAQAQTGIAEIPPEIPPQIPVVAQMPTPPPTSLFEELKTPFLIKPFFELPTYSFYLGAPDIKGYAFVPNYATRLGITLGWKATQLTVAFALPIPKEELDRRGNSDQQSIILHTRWREHAIDFYSQYYRGLYAGNPLTEFSFSKPERFTQFPDASVSNIGANFYYVFDEAHYSPRAAFDQTKIPLSNGGSWFAMPFLNYLVLDMGDKIIVGSESDAIQTKPDINHLQLVSLGSTFGYGHTWLIPNYHSSFSVQSSIGPAIQSQTVENPNTATERTLGVSGKWGFKICLAHNTTEDIWGARIFTDTLYSRLGSLDIYSTVMSGQLFYGYRF